MTNTTSNRRPALCDCPDDRCAGYHHEIGEPCGCVDVATLAALVAPVPASTLARQLAGRGVLTFTYPDQLTVEQRQRIAATMHNTFTALVQDARRTRAAEGVER